MKHCHYCMQPIVGEVLEADGVYFHPQCHKDAVLEICYFCDNEDRDCPKDCPFLPWAEKYLEEEMEELRDES